MVCFSVYLGLGCLVVLFAAVYWLLFYLELLVRELWVYLFVLGSGRFDCLLMSYFVGVIAPVLVWLFVLCFEFCGCARFWV